MKFIDKRTGATYEPTDEVAAMMAANPNLEKVEPKPAPKKPAPKRAAKPKE